MKDIWPTVPLLLALSGSAVAGENWRAPALMHDGSVGDLSMGASMDRGLVPEFRSGERDRLRVEGEGIWRPSPIVGLGVAGDWRVDSWPAGDRRQGWGDLRLSAVARPLPDGWRGLRPQVGWTLKLPNAGDEQELGSDETDGSFWLGLAGSVRGAEIVAAGGLGILGNPLQIANQDDVPLTWLSARVPIGPAEVRGAVGGAWATSRNPSRMRGTVAVAGACPWLSGVEFSAGLSPAAPDLGARAWVGWGFGCPDGG